MKKWYVLQIGMDDKVGLSTHRYQLNEMDDKVVTHLTNRLIFTTQIRYLIRDIQLSEHIFFARRNGKPTNFFQSKYDTYNRFPRPKRRIPTPTGTHFQIPIPLSI